MDTTTRTTRITPAALAALRVGEVVFQKAFPRITEKLLRLFALSLRDGNPLWHDKAYAEVEGPFTRRAVPTAYVSLFNPMENGGLAPASAFWCEVLGLPAGTSMWGGHAAYNRVELERPMFVGDTIRVEVANRGAFEKHGKQHLLIVAETDYRLYNQDNVHLGICTYGNMVQTTYGKEQA
jgi:acyl dehydratase